MLNITSLVNKENGDSSVFSWTLIMILFLSLVVVVSRFSFRLPIIYR